MQTTLDNDTDTDTAIAAAEEILDGGQSATPAAGEPLHDTSTRVLLVDAGGGTGYC